MLITALAGTRPASTAALHLTDGVFPLHLSHGAPPLSAADQALLVATVNHHLAASGAPVSTENDRFPPVATDLAAGCSPQCIAQQAAAVAAANAAPLAAAAAAASSSAGGAADGDAAPPWLHSWRTCAGARVMRPARTYGGATVVRLCSVPRARRLATAAHHVLTPPLLVLFAFAILLGGAHAEPRPGAATAAAAAIAPLAAPAAAAVAALTALWLLCSRPMPVWLEIGRDGWAARWGPFGLPLWWARGDIGTLKRCTVLPLSPCLAVVFGARPASLPPLLSSKLHWQGCRRQWFLMYFFISLSSFALRSCGSIDALAARRPFLDRTRYLLCR